MDEKWIEPEAGAEFLCDDGTVRTWAQMTEFVEPDVYPGDLEHYELLLWCFGAEPVAALASGLADRVWGGVGFGRRRPFWPPGPSRRRMMALRRCIGWLGDACAAWGRRFRWRFPAAPFALREPPGCGVAASGLG